MRMTIAESTSLTLAEAFKGADMPLYMSYIRVLQLLYDGGTVGCPKKHFFKIELSLPLGYRRSQKNFSVIDSKMALGERFLVFKEINK